MKYRPLHHIGMVLLTALSLALIGCSGGGGGGKAQSVLDAQSDQDIGRRIISVGNLMFEIGETMAGDAVGGLSTAIASGVPTGSPQPVSNTCATGSATMTITDTDSTLSAGDAIEISFDQCDTGGNIIDGSIELTVTQVDSGFVHGMTGKVETEVTFTGFSTQTTEDGKPVTYTLNGSWDGSVSYENGGGKVTFVAQVPASGSFSLSRNEQRGDQAAMTAQGLTETAIIDQATNSYTLDFDADTITFTAGKYAQASFKVTTDPLIGGPLDTFGDPADPTSGTILVEEKNGRAAMKLEIMSDSQVKVSVDVDGDGVFESSEIVSWTALTGD